MFKTEALPIFTRVAVTPDQHLIFSGYAVVKGRGGHIFAWDFRSGELVKSYQWSPDILSDLVLTPDNRFIVASGGNYELFTSGTDYDLIVEAIEIETGARRRIKWRQYGSSRLIFSWDRKYLRVDDFVWDWRTGGETKLIQKSEPWLVQTRGKINLSNNLFLSSKHRPVIVQIDDLGKSKTILPFDPGPGKKFPRERADRVTSDRRFFFSQICDANDPDEKTQNVILGMWNIQTGSLVKTFDTCRGRILDLDVTLDNRFAVVTLFDKRDIIQVIDLETEEKTLEIYPEPLKK